MKTRVTRGIAAFTLFATILTPVTAIAQENDLQGARAAGAESELQRRGYTLARTSGGSQFWWNARTDTCIRVNVWQGRYQTVARASSSDCGKDGGSAAGAVVGAALAVGLIAALASHKKNKGDARPDAGHDAEYERGYNDGLYGATYDRHDSEGYHEGYLAGETEAQNRRANNRPYVRTAPQVARDACARRADDYQNAPPGSSVPVSVRDLGRGSWEISVATGRYRSRCTVDSRGYVSDISPY